MARTPIGDGKGGIMYIDDGFPERAAQPQGESRAHGAHAHAHWTAEPHGDNSGVSIYENGAVLIADLFVPAIDRPHGMGDARKRAALMTAAPEMAAALRALVAWDDKAAKPYDWDAFYGLANDARAALRKAGVL